MEKKRILHSLMHGFNFFNADYYLGRGFSLPPKSVCLVLSRACNLKCRMCDIGRANAGEAPPEKSPLVQSMRGGPEPMQPIIDKYKVDFPVYWAGEAPLETYDIKGIPLILFFKDGGVSDKLAGKRPEDALEERIATFLGLDKKSEKDEPAEQVEEAKKESVIDEEAVQEKPLQGEKQGADEN